VLSGLTGDKSERRGFEAQQPHHFEVGKVGSLCRQFLDEVLGFAAGCADKNPLAGLDGTNCLTG